MGLQSADSVLAGAVGQSPGSARDLPAADRPQVADAPWIPTVRDIAFRRLPHANFVDRMIQRTFGLIGARQVRAVHGLEHLRNAPRPFIVAVNHNIRREALLVPALLCLQNEGRWIHFLADWNFMMIPVIGWVMRRSGVIVVTRKSAKPAFLNRFKRYWEEPTTPAERVVATLARGESVGVFPEGTVNRDPRRLLMGRVGMSRLSLESGAPIVPIGIRFPDADPCVPLSETATMEVHIGPHLVPPPVPAGQPPSLGVSRRWHATVMTEIARLSGKSWGLHTEGGDDA
jgi:1-acyl-sn-glycerol-3-phosphate acyltransferase